MYTQRIEGLEHNLQRAVSSFTETKKRLEEEQRFKEEAERKKKEFESQRDELRDTLRRERENFEKDGKLLRFACEDATKELEIVKQSYREEKQHDEQVIQGLRDALDAVVAENEEKKKVGESTFSPPATPKSKLPATPPKSPSVISQSFQMEKDQLELEVATQKELANQAKEKAERAIKTARVAMEAAATRAKTDGVKIEKLEKQLAEARRASNDETSKTTMSAKEDEENTNENED